jgi:hypothetical protein
MEVPAMQIGSVPKIGVFDERQVLILTNAFEKALRLLEIKDRKSVGAEAVAGRIIASYSGGARDPILMARKAAEK